MKPITLKELKQQYEIDFTGNGLELEIVAKWVVDGEDRLSYTSLIRLIECCREYHWETDINSLIEKHELDSITKTISVEFSKPIFIGNRIAITYRIIEVRNRGYSLGFQIDNITLKNVSAQCYMVSVFYNPLTHSVTSPPINLLETI